MNACGGKDLKEEKGCKQERDEQDAVLDGPFHVPVGVHGRNQVDSEKEAAKASAPTERSVHCCG